MADFEHSGPGGGLADRWTDIFRADFPVHFGIMASIAAACFQGFLKDRIAGVLPYALADGCFLFAFLWWFATRAFTRTAMFITPRGAMLPTLLLVGLLPALYLIVPGTPLVIQLAGLRAWSLYPVACVIALSVTYNAGQVRAYVGLVILLCVITAIYGILQYRAGPGSWFTGGALAAARHGNTVFYFVQGGASQFRAYSTFQFPAPFAAMMVYGMVLAGGFALSRFRSRSRLVWIAGLMALLFVAMGVATLFAPYKHRLPALEPLYDKPVAIPRVQGVTPAANLIPNDAALAEWLRIVPRSGPKPKMAIVATSGGGIRAAVWTTAVLNALTTGPYAIVRHPLYVVALIVGPALAGGYWALHHVYWIGPIAGAAVASVLYSSVFSKRT